VPVTRGFLDSRYRKGLEKQVPVTPGESFAADIMMKPTDYLFRKNHSIAVNVFTNNTEWMVPKGILPTDIEADCVASNVGAQAADCAKIILDWTTNKVRIVVPVVKGPKDPMELFDFGHVHS
jgi:predicted acyl esterase